MSPEIFNDAVLRGTASHPRQVNPCNPRTIAICMVITHSKSMDQPGRLPILLVVSRAGKINISLSPFAPENLVSRDGFGSPVS